MRRYTFGEEKRGDGGAAAEKLEPSRARGRFFSFCGGLFLFNAEKSLVGSEVAREKRGKGKSE